MSLLYQAEQIWGIGSHPEYADANDGFGRLMTKGALAYLVQGDAFVDEEYAGKTSGSLKLWRWRSKE